MLDDQEGLPGLVELADPLGEVLDQGRVYAAGRLVQEQHSGIGHEQRRELEQLALTEGEVPGGLARKPRDTDELEQLDRASALRARAGAADEAAHPALLALRRDEHVLEHGQPGEDARELEGPPDTELEDARRSRVRDRRAAEADLAGVGSLVAGDDVEERRLAGPVRADQAGDRTLLDLQVAHRQRMHPAKGLGDPLDLDQGGHGVAPATSTPSSPASSPPLRRPAVRARRELTSCVMLGTTPRGSSKITNRNSAP